MAALMALQGSANAGFKLPASATTPAGSDEKTAKCAFRTPEGWAGRTIAWEGPCDNGKASGIGVLRGYASAGSPLIFYGELLNGEIRAGVTEREDGYEAGQYREGRLVSSASPQVTLSAFDLAVKAAQMAALNFEARGNAASARFYRNRAERLAAQMD